MLILASNSISRKNLLKSANIKFFQISSFFDESLIKEENINKLALELSYCKADIVSKKIVDINLKERLNLTSFQILGCDSIFEFKGKAFGKPRNKEEAYKRWLDMSSNYGYLHTGHSLLFCEILNKNKTVRIVKEVKKVISSKIGFSKLHNSEISKYVNTLEPLNCSGGFALEGKAGKYIEKIEGCFSNVMGLSLPWLREVLFKEGIIA
mgnify:CR=1 FL=1